MLLDDDTYHSGFPLVERKEEGVVDLEWEDTLYVAVGGERDLENTQVYLIICVNTEPEISYLDRMIATVISYVSTSFFSMN